jgi:hypothetical protein
LTNASELILTSSTRINTATSTPVSAPRHGLHGDAVDDDLNRGIAAVTPR